MRRQKRTLYTHLKYGLKRSGAYKKETQKKEKMQKIHNKRITNCGPWNRPDGPNMCISLAGLYGSLCYAGGINIWAK